MQHSTIAGAWPGPARRTRAATTGAARFSSRAAWPSPASLASETLAILGQRSGPLLACALAFTGVEAAGALATTMNSPEAGALSQAICQFYRQSAAASGAPNTIGFELMGAACAWDALKLMVLILKIVAGALVLPSACGTVAWIGLRGRTSQRISWSRAWRALAGRRRVLTAGWLCCAILTAVALTGLGSLPHDRVQATELAIDAPWSHNALPSITRGDVLRPMIQRSLRGSAFVTSAGTIEWLAALTPDRPPGLDEVCRNYQLSMAPLQMPNSEKQLGMDCTTSPAGETAPPALPVAMLAVLAGAVWPFVTAAILSPGASRRRADMLRCLPVVLAHAGLLSLATLAATWLFIALPAAMTPAVWAVLLLHAPWAVSIIEPLTAISSTFASSLLAVSGLVYAARLCAAVRLWMRAG